MNGEADYVSVAMDENLQITYGTKLCIPEINDYYGMNIEFRVSGTEIYIIKNKSEGEFLVEAWGFKIRSHFQDEIKHCSVE